MCPSRNSPETILAKFSSLSLDIRCLIWEATLPETRVFQVQATAHIPGTDAKTFKFYINHEPPIALSICQESRQLALRKGYFIGSLSLLDNVQGCWFNPSRDMLYLDRNQRRALQLDKNYRPADEIQGLDRVQHFGIEWRAIMLAAHHRLQPAEDMGALWRPFFRRLRPQMPMLKTFNYILPTVRLRGCHSWAREPYQSQHYDCELEALCADAQIPWGDAVSMRRPPNGTGWSIPRAAAPGIIAHKFITPSGNPAYYMLWSQVHEGLQMAMRDACRELEERHEKEADKEDIPDEYGIGRSCKVHNVDEIEVVGWRLLRIGAILVGNEGPYLGIDE